jgi:DNA-binding transcriptional regulator YiaG
LSDEDLRSFWAQHKPEDLKLLGDRLLAECLPRYPERPGDFYAADLDQVREGLGLTVETVARRLGVSRTMLRCWEQGDIRPPASLKLLYTKLTAAP